VANGQLLYPRRGSTKDNDSSDSDDDVSMQSQEAHTSPVAPIRKARRRTLTLEKQDSRGRTRTRERAKSPTETDSSDPDEDDEDVSFSKDSSKSSLPNTASEPASLPTTHSNVPPTATGWQVDSSNTTSSGPDSSIAGVPILEVSDLSSSPLATAPKVSISRPAPPRYILRKAFKRIKLQNPLPPVMILHLKRFYGTNSGSMKKIDDFVSFETEFDFAPFVFPPSSSLKKSKMVYRLTGVVIHLGSINSGQYPPRPRKSLLSLCVFVGWG
jgi:hypothetical protein